VQSIKKAFIMAIHNDLFKIYDKCSEGYHRVDDFRSKLLTLLPLSSGIAILGSLFIEQKTGSKFTLNGHNIAIGLFGFIVTIGLLIYELKGIEKCTQFIKLGKWIEAQMDGNVSYGDARKGYFTELLTGNEYVNEPVASAIVYSIVLALWSYVFLLGTSPYCLILIPIIYTIAFKLIIRYWKNVYNKNDVMSFIYTKNDVTSFVYSWFAGFDHKRENTFFHQFLPAGDIDMFFPDFGEIKSIEKFNEWYNDAKEKIVENYHDIKHIEINEIQQNKRWEVPIYLIWNNTVNNEIVKKAIYQKWVVELDKNLNLKIIKHQASLIE
jgi:hypothetical protein